MLSPRDDMRILLLAYISLCISPVPFSVFAAPLATSDNISIPSARANLTAYVDPLSSLQISNYTPSATLIPTPTLFPLIKHSHLPFYALTDHSCPRLLLSSPLPPHRTISMSRSMSGAILVSRLTAIDSPKMAYRFPRRAFRGP